MQDFVISCQSLETYAQQADLLCKRISHNYWPSRVLKPLLITELSVLVRWLCLGTMRRILCLSCAAKTWSRTWTWEKCSKMHRARQCMHTHITHTQDTLHVSMQKHRTTCYDIAVYTYITKTHAGIPSDGRVRDFCYFQARQQGGDGLLQVCGACGQSQVFLILTCQTHPKVMPSRERISSPVFKNMPLCVFTYSHECCWRHICVHVMLKSMRSVRPEIEELCAH